MMKKLLLKSMLIAIGIVMGSGSAWADEISPSATVLDPSQTEAAGSSATSWEVGQIVNTGTSGVKNTSGPMLIAQFDVSSVLSGKTLVSANLDFDITPVTSGTNSSMRIFVIGTDWDAATAKWGDVTLTRENPVSDAKEWTTKNATKNCSFDVKSFLNDDEDKVIGFLIGVNTARSHTVTNLKLVVEAVDASSATTYSIEKYDISGNLIESTTDISGEVGTSVSVSSSDEDTFYSDDTSKKYVFDSENENNITNITLSSNASDNVFKLYFNSYDKYTATIKSICGENTIDDITGSWYSDSDPITLYYPKVVSCNDEFYVVEANESEPLYGHTFSTSDLSQTVTYILDKDIAYYSEYESLCGKVYSSAQFTGKSSKGGSWMLTGSNTMKTKMNLTNAGLFNITIAGGNRDTGHTTTMELKLIDSESNISEDNVISQYMSGGAWMGEMTANVIVPAGSEFYIANDNGTGNAKFAGDYIIVRKLADITNPDNIIGAVDCSTAYLDDMTEKVTLSPGDMYNYKFVNHNNGGSNWFNWVLPVYSGEDRVITVRSDFWEDVVGANSGCTATIAWDDFVNQMNGATVDMDVEYTSDNVFKMNSTITTSGGSTWTYSYTSDYTDSGIALTGDIQIALSVSSSWLEVLSEGAIASITKTFPDFGYATFSHTAPVTVPEGVTVYTGKATETSIVLTEVEATVIPANIGVIIQGTGTVNFVETSETGDATAFDGNELIPTSVEANQTVNESGYYGLSSSALKFIKVGSGVTFSANKAYIKGYTGTEAKSLSVTFGDDATAIENIEVSAPANAAVYNLSGQKVDNDYKGIIIKNGKKYLNK